MPKDLEITSLVEEILELPAASVSLADDLEELGWDSLANITFMSIIDERFSVRVDPQRLAESETPAELGRLVS